MVPLSNFHDMGMIFSCYHFILSDCYDTPIWFLRYPHLIFMIPLSNFDCMGIIVWLYGYDIFIVWVSYFYATHTQTYQICITNTLDVNTTCLDDYLFHCILMWPLDMINQCKYQLTLSIKVYCIHCVNLVCTFGSDPLMFYFVIVTHDKINKTIGKNKAIWKTSNCQN